MRYIFILTLGLGALMACPSWAQSPADLGVAQPGPACAATRQDMQSPCSVNATSPECMTAKKAHITCMAGADAANGKGPCAQQHSLMVSYCTADTNSQQCRNATISYGNCTSNPPGYEDVH